MAENDLPLIILAAGASRRMRGTDKLLEPVDGLPLLRKQALMAQAVTSGPVLIALPPCPHSRYDVIADLPVTAVPVALAAEGMNASLRAAFAALPTGAAGAMVLLADLPELTENDLSIILQHVDFNSDTLIWRGATSDGKPGHPIVFHAALFPAIAQLSGDGGGRDAVMAAGSRVAKIPLPGQRARLDLDTPEAWADWRKANPNR